MKPPQTPATSKKRARYSIKEVLSSGLCMYTAACSIPIVTFNQAIQGKYKIMQKHHRQFKQCIILSSHQLTTLKNKLIN